MKQTILLGTLFICCATLGHAQSGQLDPSFGINGIVKTDMGSHYNNQSSARQALIRTDGSIYIILEGTFISKRFPNGSIDSSYGFQGYSSTVSLYDAYAAIQSDGKIVIIGSWNNNSFNVTRINVNGSVDSTFGNNGMQTTVFSGYSYPTSVAIQGNGRIAVAGYSFNNGDINFTVTRYNVDGSPDKTFNGTGQLVTDFGFKLPPDPRGGGSFETDIANSIAIQTDGKIVVGGYVQTNTVAGYDFAIARYNADGSLDNSFSNDGKQITDFGGNNDAGYSLAIQKDGKIVLAGYTSNGTNNLFAVVRYNTNGSLDNSFNSSGKQTASFSSDMYIGNSVAIQSTGKIVLAGYTLNGSYNDFAVVRFNTNGKLDNTFDNDGMLTTDFTSSDDYARAVLIQSDDKIIVTGTSYTYSSTSGNYPISFALSRYNSNGSLDNSFDNDGKLIGDYKQGYTQFFATAIQADGKIVAAGLTWNGNDYDFAIARYKINGSLDSTFSSDGKQITDFGGNDDYCSSLAIQSDGKILLAGYTFDNISGHFGVVRYNIDGTLDNTFNGNGKLITSLGFVDVCTSIALQSDGKIVLAGYSFPDNSYNAATFAIARLNTDGSFDNTFSQDGKQLTDFNSPSFGTSVAIQKDGKIVVGGRCYSYATNRDEFAIARYNADGSLDNSFSNDGKQLNSFGSDDYFGQSLAIQKDGKIVMAGFSETYGGSSSSFAIARYKSNGNLDRTFSNDGFQSTFLGAPFEGGTTVAIKNDGRIAVGGTDGLGNFALVLYKTNGSLDSSFSNDGIQTTDVSIRGAADGRIESIVFANDKLYAAGYGQFPGNLGVIARYLLASKSQLPVTSIEFVPKITKELFSLNIYPNPAIDILFVHVIGENEKAKFQIIDAAGKKLREGKVTLNGNTSFPIYINNLSKGMYNLELHTKTKIETRRFIKD